jgi:nickel transport protein
VRVEDADGVLLATYPLGADGTARFPLDREAASGGLSITVQTGDAHEGYWLLTPADIAGGS